MNYELVDFSHVYGSFQGHKGLSYGSEVDLHTCTDLGCLETSFLIVFDMFLTVFDMFLTVFDTFLTLFLTDRPTDRPTNRPMRGDLEAPSPELKKIQLKS